MIQAPKSKGGRKNRILVLLIIILLLTPSMFYGLDAPHTSFTSGYTINCGSCHWVHNSDSAPWMSIPSSPDPADDTINNRRCYACHDGSKSLIPAAKTHSTSTTGSVRWSTNGGWRTECVTCHDPHQQRQTRAWGSPTHLQTGPKPTVGGWDTGDNWTEITLTTPLTDNYNGYYFMPDKNYPFFYKIVSDTTGNTFNVKGDVLETYVKTGGYAIVFGKNVKESISFTNPGGTVKGGTVKLFRPSGDNGPGDTWNSNTTTSVCYVCHTQTRHWSTLPGDTTTHNDRTDCTLCHQHLNGFAHGGGSSGTGCQACHGHDAGYTFTYDGQTYTSEGRGTFQSHSTHTENDSDDLKGPNLQCSDCHNTSSFPAFKDGATTLAATTVCDPCHSPGGDYDGVNNSVIGAKENWHSGVYVSTNSSTLKAGKEKWCAGCHDGGTSTNGGGSIIGGWAAPNVIGDETGASTYGTGWGFYKTGHGLPDSSTYPASGGLTYGAGKNCDACHDFSTAHIFSSQRVYSAASNNYQTGYRLKSVNGKAPMVIPRPSNNTQRPLVPDDFRLCFACHDANRYLLQSPNPMMTNFRDDRGDPPNPIGWSTFPINTHAYHLDVANMGNKEYDSDWDGSNDSQFTCVTCHNVHGSTRLAMVNDGKLVNKEPGLTLYYAKDGVTGYNQSCPTTCPSTFPPNPPSNYVTLDQSDGTIWVGTSPGNICSNCHGGNYIKYYRTPPGAPQAPVLSWTGESGYAADGVEPNTAPGDSYFSFRVKYTDANYQIPRVVQVWVDLNDNGTYDENEKFDMQDANPADVDCSDGKIYRKTMQIPLAGDGTIKYRFYASNGKFDATGSPTNDSTLFVTNNAPVLSWTGESGYVSDGVNPDSGPGGGSITFRVKYTDADNNPPASIQVWIDENDNGSYDAGEKYTMTAVDAGDTTYSDGKLYTLSKGVAFAGDGSLHYRFYASDGTNDATGTPTNDMNLTVTSANAAPTLSWTGESNYTRDGVNPDTDTSGSSFTFRVKYTDADNNPPASIQAWVDENDDGIYEAGEKHDMTAADAGDTDYTDGRIYTTTMTIAGAGDGILNYRFYASDSSLDATGIPTEDSFVTILVNALKVNCLGGVGYYSTIQAAVNAASSGDTILVNDCIYYEKVTVDNKDLNIKSVNGAAVTIIDGGGSGGSVVKFQNGSDSTLNGFTVRNGAGGQYGGGISISSSSPTIVNSIITNNAATQYGGGIYVAPSASTANITDCTISGNTATFMADASGAGLYLGSGTSAVVSRATFSANTALNGGGIAMITGANASLSITGAAFNSNKATGNRGGAIYINPSGGTVPITIAGSTFTNNDSNDYGGAVAIWNQGATSTVTISNSTFAGNNTTTQGSPLDGGAIYMASVSSATITGTSFSGNTGRSGGAIFATNSGTNLLSITDSSFSGNVASVLQGGALYVGGGTLNIERSTIAGNSADDSGGGVYLLAGTSTTTFTNCMVVGNKTVNLDGGGLHLTGATVAPTVTNCTIAGNNASNHYGGGIVTFGGPGVVLKNSILWNNADSGIYADIFGPATVTYSDIWQPGFSGNNNISSDPLFVNPVDPSLAPTTSGDYHLLTDSPAMDAGTATGAPADDIDGNIRPIGGGYDMGADEIVTVANNAPLLTWTGETGFTSDGVNPDTGAGGSSFEFRVNYSDADNNAPSITQVWVDLNDNGIYEPGEKFTMTEVDAGDTNYTDGKLYTRTLNLSYAGDGVLKYRFYAADSYSKATGEPTGDKTVVINTAPTLSWIGSGNFVSDGVHPDSATSGSSFEFRVRYTDPDNKPPTSIQVWVDKNDDGDYLDPGEKITLIPVDPGDANYADGKEYTKTLTLTKAGDGALNYRFYASNGIPATGAPTSNNTVGVTNNIPTLAWTGEAGYTTDGVNPDIDAPGASFSFRVKYTDLDNEAPTVAQVWVDGNNNGTYDAGEKYDMTAVDPGDTVYTDGNLYTKTLTLSTAGTIKYRFVFNDTTDPATGAPASDKTVQVAVNTPPVLDWTGEPGYTSDGVNPDVYAAGTNFTFRVKYTDAENTAPTVIQLWLDLNDNGNYNDAGEKIDMTAVDPSDTTYSDGKFYTVTVNIPYAGDGVLNYRFYARDNTDAATGSATADKTVTVVNPCRVPSGIATIQLAIDSTTPVCTYILVASGTPGSPATYSENINYKDKSITIVSENGPAVTKIQGTGANAAVVTFGTTATASSGALDGFTIDNQAAAGTASRGISIGSNDSPTIKNCIIEGNAISAGQNGAGININGGTATILNTIFGTSGKPNTSGGSGGAIYATSLSSPLSISSSTIAYNTASSNGGAIYLNNTGQPTTITNTNFDHNAITNNGGAIYSDSAVTISGGALTYNSATGLDGGAIYLSGASATLSITGTSLTNNTGRYGAAIYATGAPAMTITNATINTNTASSSGGGLYLNGTTGTSTFTNTSISSNTATSNHGGGFYVSGSAMTLNNCTVDNNRTNTATMDGGGIYAINAGSNITISGGSVSSNTSRYGVGVYSGGSTTLSITGATINFNAGNSASSGGGIYSTGTSLTVSKSNIKGNRGGYDGGGIYAGATNATLTNNVITGNTTDQQGANSDGGGIYVASGTVNIYNCTIAGNYASGSGVNGGGGGLRVSGGTVTVRNSIIHSNSAGGNQQISGTPTTTYTDIQGGCAACLDRTGNIDLNPQFINLQSASSGNPITAGDYHLCYANGVPDAACTTLSPCIDSASAANAPADDIDGQTRPYDAPGVGDGVDDYDMGADEYRP